jgi:predicted amidohydrolase YtcJ
MATRLATILVIVIVGATLVAGLIVGAQRDDANGPVDLIIVNGKVYPGGGGGVQEAIAVRGNQILRVGSNRDVKRLRRAQTVVVDAHGATVLPGLNDAHVRLMAGALALQELDLSSAATLDDLEALLAEYADEFPGTSWILGRNGNSELFATGNVAARRILDENVSDRPVMLTDEGGNIAWANSEALKTAGISRRTRTVPPTAIVKDRRTGEPTGVLKAQAIDLMTQILPQPSHAEKIMALRGAIEEAHKFGVTSVQTVSRNDEELALLNEIREQGDLSVRVYGSLSVSADIDEAGVAALDALRLRYPDDPTLKLGAVEVVCSCDAVKLGRAVTLLDKHNWHVMVRASEEADVHAALDAFEHTIAVNPVPARGRRYRLEDVEAVANDDLARLPRFSVIAEPLDADAASSLWSALSETGARLLLASNWPAAQFDPREVIQDVMETQAEPSADPSAETPQSHAASLRTAVDAYTSQAAFASYDEHRKGKLAPGMLADIIILSNDIFQTPRASLKNTAVTVTIFDGKVVYQRSPQASSN